jgi:hypothetical protein
MTIGARDIFLAGVRGEPASRPAVASVCQSATYAQMDILGARWQWRFWICIKERNIDKNFF